MYALGVSVEVFGAQVRPAVDLGLGDVSVAYAIDSGDPKKESNLDPGSSPSLFQAPIFTSDVLDDGEHTITITNNGADLFIAYLKVKSKDNGGGDNSTSSAASSGSASQSSSASASSSASGTASHNVTLRL